MRAEEAAKGIPDGAHLLHRPMFTSNCTQFVSRETTPLSRQFSLCHGPFVLGMLTASGMSVMTQVLLLPLPSAPSHHRDAHAGDVLVCSSGPVRGNVLRESPHPWDICLPGSDGQNLLTMKEHYRVWLIIQAFSEKEGEFGLGESFSFFGLGRITVVAASLDRFCNAYLNILITPTTTLHDSCFGDANKRKTGTCLVVFGAAELYNP